jgi:hypothetical protein
MEWTVAQGNIVGGSILVGLVQWQAFSPYFGDVVEKLHVWPGNMRHQAATPAFSGAQTSGSTTVKEVRLDNMSNSSKSAMETDSKALLSIAPAPVSSSPV